MPGVVALVGSEVDGQLGPHRVEVRDAGEAGLYAGRVVQMWYSLSYDHQLPSLALMSVSQVALLLSSLKMFVHFGHYELPVVGFARSLVFSFSFSLCPFQYFQCVVPVFIQG